MEAIIFDVDGTLWDSTDEVAVSWNEALKRETELRRKVTAEELKKEFGKRFTLAIHRGMRMPAGKRIFR